MGECRMLIILRILRVVFGFIGVWQVLGLLPVVTNWLPNLGATTGDMWAIVLIKLVVLALCAAIYYWLGKIKKKYESADTSTNELPIIWIAIAAIFVLSIALAIALPALNHQPPDLAPAQTQSASENLTRDDATAHSQEAPPPPPSPVINDPMRSAPERPIVNVVPVTEQQCTQQYVRGPSSVENTELRSELCHSAFDTSKHPVARERALCQVMAWSTNPTRNPTDAYRECIDRNPAPACPESMKFDLENMRCEVECDGLKGYAPDSTGKACYLACPDNGWPIYVGTVLGCNK